MAKAKTQKSPTGSFGGEEARNVEGDVGFEVDFPVSPLGHRLLEIRKRIVASGSKLLSWDEIEAEVRERRGGNRGSED